MHKTNRLIRTIKFITLCCWLSSVCPSVFPSSTQSENTIRVSVNLVQVDAVVTDSKGKYVKDLSSGDFEVLQDGKLQSISDCTYYLVRNLAKTGVRTEDATLSPYATQVVKPYVPGNSRTIALVIDDLGLSFESTYYVRRALEKFVDEQIHPEDRVAIIRTSAGMGTLQQFTTQSHLLKAAIERIRFHLSGPGSVGTFNSDENPFQDEEYYATRFTAGTLGAVHFILNGLRDIPGRKAIVLISQSLKLNTSKNGFKYYRDKVLEKLKRLIEDANRASVVIYTLDPQGLMASSFRAEHDSPNHQGDTSRGKKSSDHSSRSPGIRSSLTARLEALEGLQLLAEETGGLFLKDSNNINLLMHKILEDQSGYYLLGYYPDKETFHQKAAPVRPHNIQVRVKRAGLNIRARKSFLGVPNKDSRINPTTREEQLNQALASPFASANISLHFTPLFFHENKEGSFINSLIHIDANCLSFVETSHPSEKPHEVNDTNPLRPIGIGSEPTGNGKKLKMASHPQDTSNTPGSVIEEGNSSPVTNRGNWKKTILDILVVTYDDSGREVECSNRSHNVYLRGESLQGALENGITYVVRHPIKNPGAYQMRVAVRDAISHSVGSASHFIEVPDIDKGRLQLSGIVLKSWEPQSSGQSVNTAEGQRLETSRRGGPVTRIFSPGQILVYGYEIISARTNAEKQTNLEAIVKIFHGNRLLFTGKPNKIDSSQQLDLKHIIAGGSLQLKNEMEPGDYALQIMVKDHLAEKKYNTAVQYMSFEVQ